MEKVKSCAHRMISREREDIHSSFSILVTCMQLNVQFTALKVKIELQSPTKIVKHPFPLFNVVRRRDSGIRVLTNFVLGRGGMRLSVSVSFIVDCEK